MYRVHIMARWPQVFDTLAGAIGYIRNTAGLWYALEEKNADGPWRWLVGAWESRDRGQDGVEDRS
jgi:hypothetical protein